MHASIEAKFGVWAKNHVRFRRQKHASVAELEEAVDPDGWNLVFKDVAAMKTKADLWLAASHARRVKSLSAHDAQLIETAKALRNFVAHQSASSKKEMNEKLLTIGTGSPNTGLGRGTNEVRSLGSFLKAYAGADRRIILYLRRMSAIASKM